MRLKSLCLIASTILISLVSCKKNPQTDNNLSLDGTYLSGANFELADVQMFTAEGQISDVNTIKDFVKRRELNFSWEKTEPVNFGSGKVTFIDNKQATMDLLNRSGTVVATQLTITDKTVTGFILKQNEALKNAVEKSTQRSAQLVGLANQLQSVSNCHTEVIGQNDRCDYTYLIPFVISANNLKLSYYSIALHSQQGSLTEGYSTTTAGIFNKAVTQQLIPGDTLVVQVKLLPFYKN